jgi:hypothetical protein
MTREVTMIRLRHSLAATGAAVLMGALLVVPAFAWPGFFEGKPRQLGGVDDRAGYYAWHDDDGIHLRTTGPGPRHVYRGALVTDGTFEDVQLVQLEGDDGFTIEDGGHRLEVRFETWDARDGLDFHINGGTRLRMNLNFDGHDAPLDRIWLGEDGTHPPSNPFVLPR